MCLFSRGESVRKCPLCQWRQLYRYVCPLHVFLCRGVRRGELPRGWVVSYQLSPYPSNVILVLSFTYAVMDLFSFVFLQTATRHYKLRVWNSTTKSCLVSLMLLHSYMFPRLRDVDVAEQQSACSPVGLAPLRPSLSLVMLNAVHTSLLHCSIPSRHRHIHHNHSLVHILLFSSHYTSVQIKPTLLHFLGNFLVPLIISFIQSSCVAPYDLVCFRRTTWLILHITILCFGVKVYYLRNKP